MSMNTSLIGQMTSRELEKHIRTGMTIDDFCVEYGCSEEEFDARVKIIYPQERKRSEISRKLRGNEKTKGKKSTAATPKAQSTAKSTAKPTAKPESKKKASLERPKKVESEAPQPTELELLQTKEEALSAEVCALEVAHKEAWLKHRAAADEIRSITERVEQLKSDLRRCVDEYEVQLGEARKCETEMAEKSEAWKAKFAELDQVRARITELTAVKVFVYEDGTFEAEGCKLDFDDSWETRYDELLKSNSELLEDLRKKDLRTLAKLMSLVSGGRTFDFAFDNATVEAAYYALK